MRWLLAVSVLAGQSFDRDLQPVFRQHCYACHAANVKMGSLDVETMDGLLRGGNRGTIIVPGKSAESRLYLTLTGALEPVMPMGEDKLILADQNASAGIARSCSALACGKAKCSAMSCPLASAFSRGRSGKV